MDRIEEIPPIPEALRRYAREGRLTPFTGAGASLAAQSGCPNWQEFAARLLRQLVAHGTLDHDRVHQLNQSKLNPRVQISIARTLARENGLALDFVEALHPGRDTSSATGRRLYGAIGQLAQSFVTTNYDFWLDQTFSSPSATGDTAAVGARRNLVFRPDDFSIKRIQEPNTVIHLHGSLNDSDPAGMIMTTSDYITRYSGSQDDNPVLKFLADLFSSRSVLFVGYGLDELEILEYVLRKKRQTQARSPLPHFILQPYYSSQLTLAQFMAGYFAEVGVTLIPYNIDKNDHGQLVEVLAHFAAEIPVKNVLNVARRARMEGMLDD